MLHVTTIPVTLFAQNCRILMCEATKEATVVDPGGAGAALRPIFDALEAQGARCTQIWLTHSHLDHCGGVAQLQAQTSAKLYAHPGERMYRERVREIAAMYGIPPSEFEPCPEPQVPLEGGERVTLGALEFEVRFTPGHSPGHVVFYHRASQRLIAGDTLFSGSIGRTDLPGGDHATLLESIRSQILVLPPETAVLPGHGPDTTVGQEAQSNPFL